MAENDTREIVIGKAKLLARGEYNSNFMYQELDLVSYRGSSYVCKKECTDIAPTNTEFWQLSALGENSSKHRLEVTELIAANSEITLDFQYLVGALEVYYCGERLIRGTIDGNEEDGEYAEVGEEGSISNKIIIGFDVPVSEMFPRYFDFVVKGVVDHV